MSGQTDAMLTDIALEPPQLQPALPLKPAPSRPRSASPAHARREKLRFTVSGNKPLPRSYIVEAICAIPHPVPVHALASSQCMSHLITGSDDGIVRDYDIFAAVNGKTLLTAPQRQYCGVVEGIMKAGHLRYWWEVLDQMPDADNPCSPILSLAMHSDALWAVSGSQV
jgi:transcriptional activator SPT8